jgi:hypothetical protein
MDSSYTFTAPDEPGTHYISYTETEGTSSETDTWEVDVALNGDVNLDGRVDIFDLVSVGEMFGTSDPGADIYPLSTAVSVPNGDGVVDIVDLAAVALNFGRGD